MTKGERPLGPTGVQSILVLYTIVKGMKKKRRGNAKRINKEKYMNPVKGT
jgi:hypothetical protein